MKPNISNERLDEIAALLVESNKAAKHAAHELVGKKKYQAFRLALRGKRPEELSEGQLRLIRMLPTKEVAIMRAAESVVEELTTAFFQLIRSIARRFADQYTGMETGELIGPGWTFFQQAIFGYDKPKYKFVTYARKVIRREMVRHCLSHRIGGVTSTSSRYLNLLVACFEAEKTFQLQNHRLAKADDIYSMIRDQFPRMKRLRQVVVGLMSPLRCVTDLAHSDTSDAWTDRNIVVRNEYAMSEDQELLRAQGELVSDDEVTGMLNRAELTDVMVEVLRARALDVPLSDIAERHNIPVHRVKALLSQGRQKLRKIA